jgi:hypothetical protein
MYYTDGSCPICSNGAIGFRKCSDGRTIVLMCDECNAVWLRPDAIKQEAAIYPSAPDYIVSAVGCSIASPNASWAELHDIKAAGWEKFVAGHGEALGD